MWRRGSAGECTARGQRFAPAGAHRVLQRHNGEQPRSFRRLILCCKEQQGPSATPRQRTQPHASARAHCSGNGGARGADAAAGAWRMLRAHEGPFARGVARVCAPRSGAHRPRRDVHQPRREARRGAALPAQQLRGSRISRRAVRAAQAGAQRAEDVVSSCRGAHSTCSRQRGCGIDARGANRRRQSVARKGRPRDSAPSRVARGRRGSGEATAGHAPTGGAGGAPGEDRYMACGAAR